MAELTALFGERLSTDAAVLERYLRDRALLAEAGMPRCVVKPRHVKEVQELARWASRHGVAIVPRGAGTGVAGGATASQGCAVLSFEEMNRVLSVDEAGMLAVVEPGVLNVTLKNAARERGLFYPPDPASYEISTLGGNVATNAGGLCCVKYGVTGDYVLGLEAVRADGEVFRTGGKCRKDVAGYDLTRLLVGSEGTLALITELTLRLVRQPPEAITLRASFDSLEAAGRAVAQLVRTTDCSALELMDRVAVQAVEQYLKVPFANGAAAVLIAQSDAGRSDEHVRMGEACKLAGATELVVTREREEGEALLLARRAAFPAVERLGTVLLDDVVVPPYRLPEMLVRIERRAAEAELVVATVAHAGDGNIHPLIVLDPSDATQASRASALFEALMDDARELCGSITGEHGVGNLKRSALLRQLDPINLELQRSIKNAFDPLGILNPGKVFALPA